MRGLAVVAILVSGLGLAGCNRSPSDSEICSGAEGAVDSWNQSVAARVRLQNMSFIKGKPACKMELVSCEKTDGVASEVNEIKTYRATVAVRAKFATNCMKWTNPAWHTAEYYVDEQAPPVSEYSLGGFERCDATEILTSSGTASCMKSEKGWNCSLAFELGPFPSASTAARRSSQQDATPESGSTGTVPPAVPPHTSDSAVPDPEAFCQRYVGFIKAEPTAADVEKCKAEIDRPMGSKERESMACIARCSVKATDAQTFRACATSECQFNPPAPSGPAASAAATGDRPAGFPEEIPAERSKPPTVQEWNAAEKVELEPRGCFRKVVREWLKLNCSRDDNVNPDPRAFLGLDAFGREGGDYFVWSRPGQTADVIVRMVRGRRSVASLQLGSKALSLGYDWSGNGPFPRLVWE